MEIKDAQKFAIFVGYSESKYRLRISLAHPRDCHFAHVRWLFSTGIVFSQTMYRNMLEKHM